MIEPCLRVENLHVTYDIGSTAFGRRRRLHAVNGVSFEIGAGETLGLVGESGSGKSTTGLAILRLIEPAGGKVTLAGTDLTALGRGDLRALRRHMQMVFQDPYSSLNPSMTIQQLLEEPLIVHADLSRPERRDAVAGVLQSVGLHADYSARYPHEFSGGQRQRIAIARAMIVGPEFVVLDEPVSALDVSTQSQILNLLKRIQVDSGTAFLFVAHDLAVVRLMCPRVAVMYLGEIVEAGPSSRVYEKPAHPYTAALISAIPFPDPERQKNGGIGCPGYQDDWEVFGVGAADRVECGKRSHAERDDGSSSTACTRVSLGAEAAIQFIRAIHLLHARILQKLIEQCEIVIARNREVMFQPNLRQTSREITADRVGHNTLHFGCGCGKELCVVPGVCLTRCDVELSTAQRLGQPSVRNAERAADQ